MKKIKIIEFFDIYSGLSLPKDKFIDGNISFITFKYIYNNINLKHYPIDTVKVDFKKTFSLKAGDFFLTRTSETADELGMSCVVLKKMENIAFNGFSKLLRMKVNNENLICPLYLSYYLRCEEFRNQIRSMSTLSTRASLNNEMISKLYINVPSLEEQKQIADRISVYDDKIENNNKIIKVLEDKASLLYKRYFIDFEFPDSNGLPYKSNGGEFKESEMGMIPVEWATSPLEELYDVILGGTPSRKNLDFWNGDINWINSGKMSDIRITKESEKITLLGLEKSATKLMPKGTCVLAITGYLNVESISILEIDACGNQSVIGLVKKEKYDGNYAHFMIKNNAYELYKNQTGSAQQHINKNDVNKFKIFKINDMKIMKKINEIYYLVSNLVLENDILTKKRDLLIEELIK